MAYRHIVIRNPARLSTKNEQLIITQEQAIQIPLEDISTLTIEEPAVTLTAVLLSKCTEYHIGVIICDQKRMPSGLLQPFHRHSRQKAGLDLQLSLPKPFKKRVWQQIVIRKLENQARCLELLHKADEAQQIYAISRSVESGDRTNREAYGARLYFMKLFGETFNRRHENIQNIALNYGYSIVRSLVSRSLVRYGFTPSLGIFHDSQTNAFNLADDFVEVLRPFVDVTVALYVKEASEWSKEIREKLFALLNYEAVWKNEKQSLTNGVDRMIQSYITACRNTDPSYLVLPELVSLNQHEYE